MHAPAAIMGIVCLDTARQSHCTSLLHPAHVTHAVLWPDLVMVWWLVHAHLTADLDDERLQLLAIQLPILIEVHVLENCAAAAQA